MIPQYHIPLRWSRSSDSSLSLVSQCQREKSARTPYSPQRLALHNGLSVLRLAIRRAGDMSEQSGAVKGFESVPDEILSMILEHHFDIARNVRLKMSQPQSDAPRLQFRHELQMSLCRVSKRFNYHVSYLFRRNGLLRVTCLLDRHLDFYYLLPTICHSERTDMFQVPCPHITIDLSHGLSDVLLVRAIICASALPTALDLARLHHTAGCVLLPNVFDVHPLNDRLYINISSHTAIGRKCVGSVTSSVFRHLPALQKVSGAEGNSTYELERQAQGSQDTLAIWAMAFQIARIHCVSTDTDRRRLGLQILRYLLLSMMVVVNPWDPSTARSQYLDGSLKMMVLSSAALIDALVVEPKMLEVFYGKTSQDVAHTFHQEICPCTYLPGGIDSANSMSHRGVYEVWPLAQPAVQFFHCLLICDPSIRKERLESFRQMQAGLPSGTGIKERCSVYVRALEESITHCECSDCIVSEATIYFTDLN